MMMCCYPPPFSNAFSVRITMVMTIIAMITVMTAIAIIRIMVSVR